MGDEERQVASMLCQDVANRLETATGQLHTERIHSEQRITKIETVLEQTAENLKKLTDVVGQNQSTIAVIESAHKGDPLGQLESRLVKHIEELDDAVDQIRIDVVTLQEKAKGNITSERLMRAVWTLVGASFSGMLVYAIVQMTSS